MHELRAENGKKLPFSALSLLHILQKCKSGGKKLQKGVAMPTLLCYNLNKS